MMYLIEFHYMTLYDNNINGELRNSIKFLPINNKREENGNNILQTKKGAFNNSIR